MTGSSFSRTLATLTAFSLLPACGSGGTTTLPEVAFSLAAESHDFGAVQVGAKVAFDLNVENTGSAAIDLAVRPSSGFDESYTVDPRALKIPISERKTVTIEFVPPAEGDYSATIDFAPTGADGATRTFTVSGTAFAQSPVNISTRDLAIASTLVDTIRTATVTLTNRESEPLQVVYDPNLNVATCDTPPNVAAFCISPSVVIGAGGRFTLAGNGTAVLSVRFRPTLTGMEMGSFSIKACTTCVEETVMLRGTGVDRAMVCDAEAIMFGQVNPNSCVVRTLTCSNITNEPVTITEWRRASSPISLDFEFEAFTAPVTLQEGDAQGIDVTYCPDGVGADEGGLQITTTPASQSITIPVRGSGGGPDLRIAPAQVDFGEVSVLAPARRTLVLSNVGFERLEVTNIAIEPANREFTASAAATILDVGESYALSVSLEPDAPGLTQGVLVITSNDPDSPEVRIPLRGTGVSLPPCGAQIPSMVALGTAERGRIARRLIPIRNTGTSECLVTQVELAPSTDPGITLTNGPIYSARIAVGGALWVPITFAPDRVGSAIGTVQIGVSDPAEPFRNVALTASGVERGLLVTPRILSFGALDTACASTSRTVTMVNGTGAVVSVASVTLAPDSSPAYALGPLPPPLPGNPLVISVGQSASVEVRLAGNSGRHAGALEIAGSIGPEPFTYVVSLDADKSAGARQEDLVIQGPHGSVDILMVVDHTPNTFVGSGGPIGAGFIALTQTARGAGTNYQVSHTSTDINDEAGRTFPLMGVPEDRIITSSSMPTPAQAFSSLVPGRGPNGGASPDESGLEAARLALSSPVLFEHNAGFLRRDAQLAVVIVTDEPDQSPWPVDAYARFFRDIKGADAPNRTTVSAIAGAVPAGCSGARNAIAAPSLVEMANRTGGFFGSVCDLEFLTSLEAIGTAATGLRDRFVLLAPAQTGTLEVRVDGVLLPEMDAAGDPNWTHDPTFQTVAFSTFGMPEPGAELRMSYRVACP